MGAYINPEKESKESFLDREGVCLDLVIGSIREGKFFLLDDCFVEAAKDRLYVCLVDSGTFTAAAILYSSNEVKYVVESMDNRPKSWYIIDRSKLYDVSNLENYLPKEAKFS